MKMIVVIASILALTGCTVLTPEQSAALQRFHDGMQQAQYDLQASQPAPVQPPPNRQVCDAYPGLDGQVQTICH